MDNLKIEKPLTAFLTNILKNGGIYVIVCSPKTYNTVNLFIINYFIQENKKSGIYLTLNKRYEDITKILENNRITTSKLHFIDGVTRSIDKNKTSENCTFISNPSALTDLSLALTTKIATGKFEFIFIDSVNTILLYNTLKITEKFMHFIITKMKATNINGLIFSLEEENAENLIPSMAGFCDGILYTKDLEK